MNPKVISAEIAAGYVKNGDTLCIGGGDDI
jgi:acyl CoA:acetate/3-ketoacid CoA transferase alpha subunit